MCQPAARTPTNFKTPDSLESHGAGLIRVRSQLELLEQVSGQLAGAEDMDAAVRELAQWVAAGVGAEAASVLIADPQGECLEFSLATGMVGDALIGRRLPIDGPSIAAAVFRTRRPAMLANVVDDSRWDQTWDAVTGFRTHSLLAAPLLAGGRCVGVVELLNRGSRQPFRPEDARLLGALAAPLALALENARLYRELRRTYARTAEALAAAIEAKDYGTYAHVARVRRTAHATAAAVGIRGAELESLELGAVLHDVGKVSIDHHILLKPEALSPDEWRVVREHPIAGWELVQRAGLLQSASAVVRHHHEQWDGKGYPDNLSGEGIPLSARVVAVADAYDAMTSDRPYREGLSPDEARRRLREGAGSQFDPAIVPVFLSTIASLGQLD